MQNVSTHVIFDSLEEARHYTNLSLSDYKFSIIDEIDCIKRYSNENYEFILCYPELYVCNHWQQKVSPLKIKESRTGNDAQEVGLKKLDDRFTLFKGLMLSANLGTLFDCDEENYEYWGYSVGIACNYSNFLIPGPHINNEWYNVHAYELFLRVPFISNTCIRKIKNNIPFTLFCFFIYLVFTS